MKNLRKIFTMVLALMMVLSFAVPAFAAEETVEVGTSGHTYYIYQIFSGTNSADDATLSDIKWGSGVKGDDLLAALKAAETLGSYFSACENAAAVAKVLETYNTVEAIYNGFAKIAVEHLDTPVKDKNNVAIEVTDDTETVELDAGYYLFLDITEVDGEYDAQNPALLQVTKAGVVKINKKYNVPVTEKTVWDGSQYGIERVDAMIGEDVTFQIVGSLADGMGHYEKYTYIFHDDLPEGAVVVGGSVKVYLAKNASASELYLINPNSYVITNGTECEACDLEVKFADLRSPIQKATTSITSQTANVAPINVTYEEYTVSATDDIWVVYDAELTEDAKVWLVENLVYNQNDAYVEFSNDPHWTDDPENPDDVPPTGITPESDAKVYTTQVTIEKVDESMKYLTGAKFQLSGEGVKCMLITREDFHEVDNDTYTPAEGETVYWKLTDGTYTATNPATVGLDTSTYVDVNVTYVKRVETELQEAATETNIVAEVGADGVLKFGGLNAGTYTLTELEAPVGYDKLEKPITLVITFHPEGEGAANRFTYSWKHEGEETVLSSTYKLQIVNTKGSVLPETGGMGTTIFYVTGAIMVLAAVVLLVTKKRMAAAN